jgi:hypothetical protein
MNILITCKTTTFREPHRTHGTTQSFRLCHAAY